jgi:hypothetical protein
MLQKFVDSMNLKASTSRVLGQERVLSNVNVGFSPVRDSQVLESTSLLCASAKTLSTHGDNSNFNFKVLMT